MSGAQIIFAIALGIVTLVVTGFALYVASSTMWGDRWYGRRKPDDPLSRLARPAPGTAGSPASGPSWATG